MWLCGPCVGYGLCVVFSHAIVSRDFRTLRSNIFAKLFFACSFGAQVESVKQKNHGRKSRDTVPLRFNITSHHHIIHHHAWIATILKSLQTFVICLIKSLIGLINRRYGLMEVSACKCASDKYWSKKEMCKSWLHKLYAFSAQSGMQSVN